MVLVKLRPTLNPKQPTKHSILQGILLEVGHDLIDHVHCIIHLCQSMKHIAHHIKCACKVTVIFICFCIDA